METGSIYVTMSKTTAAAAINGRIRFEMLSTEVSATADAKNRFAPYGGVMKPIAKLMVITIPNCTGSIPMPTAIGSRIGVRIMQEDILSIKQPMISNMILTNIIMTIGLLVKDNSPLATIVGICAIVRYAAKAMDKPIIKVVCPLTRTVSRNAMYNSFKFISL